VTRVQIDDAGWGCLLLGTIIGAYRTDTQEFACGEIPGELFQGAAFAQRRCLEGGIEVVKQLLQEQPKSTLSRSAADACSAGSGPGVGLD